MNTLDTCNALVAQALAVFTGTSGINAQLAVMSLSSKPAPVETIMKMSAPIDVYEKTASLRYPVVTIFCERLKNTQAEKFRALSGTALLVVEIRVSGAHVQHLDAELNSYVEAACQVLAAARGAWTSIGAYAGGYDVKFQPARAGGKQFAKSARIEFEIHVSQ
jgi:hypothetical protein